MLAQEIAEGYIASGDFNGYPADALCAKISNDWESIKPLIRRLIERNLVAILTPQSTMNPHIVRLGFPKLEHQTTSLDYTPLCHACLYPTARLLKKRVPADLFHAEPFKRRLALGAPHLTTNFFDLTILEMYRNDPRYSYTCNDIGGQIAIKDDFYLSKDTPHKDKVLVKEFGFAYDKSFNRSVVAFTTDLADLSPEHQQIWNSKGIDGELQINADWYNSQVHGQWPTSVSIFVAFLQELYLINCMAEHNYGKKLFRTDYGRYAEERPSSLSFLVRPTASEFEAFVLLLDKHLSDNIEKKFFPDSLEKERDIKRSDGKIVVEQLGTIVLLDTWVRKEFKTDDWTHWDSAISTIRNVRKLRQSPAHKIGENSFDNTFFQKQRDLMIDVYGAVRLLRTAFQSKTNLALAKIEIPDWLDDCKIQTY